MGRFHYDDDDQRRKEPPPLPMDLAELRATAQKLQRIIDEGALDRLRREFQEQNGWQGGYHDGERYHQLRPTPVRAAESDLHNARRDGEYDRHPLVKALVALLKVPTEQAIAVVIELEVNGERRAMLNAINDAHRNLSKPRRASA